MRTRNQISLTRKTINWIMLLGVISSAFGAGSLPAAHAQEAGTDVPTTEVTVTPQSELRITNISFSPASPFTNDDVWVYVDVKNDSINDAPGFWTDFYIDDTPTGCEDWGTYYGWVDGLAANETFTWWTRLPANSLASGAHQFTGFVDSGCEASESDETNNILSAPFTLGDPSSAAPTHDDFDTARLVSPIPYTDILDVSGATTAADDPYVPDCGGYGLTPGMSSVWYQYTPSANTSLYLDTFGSDFDTYIAVWQGARGSLSSFACNDDYDHAGANHQSGLQVDLTAGTTYYFEVAEWSDSIFASSLSAASGTETNSLSSTAGSRVTKSKSAPDFKEATDVAAQAGGTLHFHVVELIMTTIAITSDTPDPSQVGQAVAVMVTVTSGATAPAGSVDITGADTNCTITLSGGSGSCHVNFASHGLKTLTATYNGDGTHSSSSDTESHIVALVASLRSNAADDGWILESTETSGVGGTLNATATTFNLGDDPANKQYRSILHFDTSSLPDGAVITKVTLKIKKQGLVGVNPFTVLGGLLVDMRKPAFDAAALALGDFKAAAGRSMVATFGATPLLNWYSAVLNSPGMAYVNKTGTTQFRLRFATDDNNNNLANTMRFFSGNAPAASRPQLIIEYTIP